MNVTKAFEDAKTHFERGDLEEAASIFADLAHKSSGAVDTERAAALHGNGTIAFAQGRVDDATALMCDAVDLDGGNSAYFLDLGRIHLAAGRAEAALNALDRAVALGLETDDVQGLRAESLVALGRLTEAVRAAQSALDVNAENARANLMLGLALLEQGDNAGATGPLGRAVHLAPHDPDANYHRARLAQTRGDLTAAEEHYLRALAERPGFVEALNNLGNVRRAQGRFLDAESAFRRAGILAPNVAAIHMNHGVALQEIDEDDAAQRAYDRAIEIDPDLAEARRNRALLWMKKGRLADGFKEYEWRWKTKTFAAVKPPVEAPRWSSEPTDGTVVFWSEQGIGDAIQFVRYAPILKSLMRDGGHENGRLIVVAPASVKRLFESVDGVDAVLSPNDPMPDADWQLPMMSAPYIAGTTFSTIPADCPYLAPSAKAVSNWASLAEPSRLNVGLVWSGDTRHVNDLQRSAPAGQFLPLLGVAGTRIHLLQVGPASDQSMELVRQGARQIGHQFKNFDCTAGAIAALDLVIAVDTAVAHLAGALNKPVWIPLSTVQDWRWFEFLEESPWYPSARLFRQREAGEWAPVIDDICAELTKLAAAKTESVET